MCADTDNRPTRVTPYDFDWLRVSNEAVTECKDLLDANRLSSEERKKLERILLALKDELILRFSDLAFLHRCKVRSNEFTGEREKMRIMLSASIL